MTLIQNKKKYRPANTRMVYKIPLFFLPELLYCDPDKAPAELPCAECFSWYTFWPIFICLVHFSFLVHFTLIGTFSCFSNMFFYLIFLFLAHLLFGTSLSSCCTFVFWKHLAFREDLKQALHQNI